MFTPETVIQNRYRIVRHLEGTQGEVYEAFDETAQKAVTVQVSPIPDPSTLERLQHVATARSKSIHPSLPAIVDHFAEGEQYILVTEWVEGSTLAERLASQGIPFAPAQVLRWGIQVLDALMVLHRQMPTLAHGDVRAETLIEKADGTLEVLGTDLYSIGGTHAPTEDEDVYDTCALLYHLLTGVKPPAMAGRSARGFLPSADTLNPLVPASLGTLLAQGLSENEEDRFNSAYALQNALHRIQEKLNESATVIAPPPPRPVPSLASKLQQRQSPTSGTDSPSLETGVLPVPLGAESGSGEGATIYPSIYAEEPDTPNVDLAVEQEALQSEAQPSGFEPQPIASDSLFSNTPSNDTPAPEPDPFKASFGSGEPAPDMGATEGEPPAGPPPISEPPPAAAPPPPPKSQNRLWFALGIGCLGAILCICCGLIGLVTYQFDEIMEELEAADITIPEPDATADADSNENNPFNPNDNEQDSQDSGDESVENNDGITVSVFDIKVGDCYQDPDETEFVTELTLVDCDAPHDNEIYAFGLYPADDGAPFPDEETLDEFTDEYCTEVFEEYVGIAYEDSIYYITYLQPTESSWEDGDREVVCILYDQDGPMEGSKKDSQE
jgi:hypothetical protein